MFIYINNTIGALSGLSHILFICQYSRASSGFCFFNSGGWNGGYASSSTVETRHAYTGRLTSKTVGMWLIVSSSM